MNKIILNILLLIAMIYQFTYSQDIAINSTKDSLYLYDDFSIEGTYLTNENGSSGKGWSGNWTYPAGLSSGVRVNKDYIYNTQGQFGITRYLQNPILLESSTFYIAFLAKKNETGNFRISGIRSDGADRFAVHVKPGGELGAQAGVAYANTTISDESFFDNHKTYLVIAKYWYTDKGNMSIVLFEEGEAIPENEASVNWDITASGDSTDVTIDYIRIAYTAASTLLDELKIGDTWKSVTSGEIGFSLPPVAPTQIEIMPTSETSLQLKWLDNDVMEAGYTILQDGNFVGSVGANVTTSELTGLTGGNIYTFGIFSYTNEGNSDTTEISVLFNYNNADIQNSEVWKIDQDLTSEAKNWSYTVTSPGNYQIGFAWIWVEGENEEVDFTIHAGGKLLRTIHAKSAAAPYRFETRLENLSQNDEITVSAIPKGDASYRMGYKLAFATPVFDGMPVYDVHAYGATGDGTTNDYQAVVDACNDAKRLGGGIIRFDGSKEYRIIGDKGYILFDFDNNSNIKVEGNGAKIILHPYGDFASIVYSENIQIDGFTTTYDPLPYYQGTITKIDVENLYLEMQVPERYDTPETGTYDVTKFGRSFWVTGPDRMGDGQNLYIARTEQIGDDDHAIRVFLQDHETARLQISKDNNASHYIVPHIEYGMKTSYRPIPYAFVKYSSRVKMSNILTQSVCHFGFTVGGNFGPVTFSNVDMLAPDRENDLHVTWRDGWHVYGNRYGIMIEDGDYDGGLMYDDIFSPHMKIPTVENVSGETVRLRSKDGEGPLCTAKEIWQIGDWVSFWDENQTTYYGMARITNVTETSSINELDVTIDRNIDGVAAGAFAMNEESINRDMVIRNCTSTPQGRKVADRQRTPILYQDCDFRNIHFYIAMDGAWRTKPRNILFDNCYINERLTFNATDTWNLAMKNCTINNAKINLNNCRKAYIDGVKWTNASEDAIEARNNSHAFVFGDYSYNGDASIVSDKSIKDVTSTITFGLPDEYPSDAPPFLPGEVSGNTFANEPFEINTDVLTNTGSGEGWNGDWTSSKGDIGIDPDESLGYPDGILMNSAGGRIAEVYGGASNERKLQSSIYLGGGTFYLSFLAKKTSSGSFEITTNNSDGNVRFGFLVATDGTVNAQSGTDLTSGDPDLFKNDVCYFVLVKFTNENVSNAVTRIKLFEPGVDILPENENSIEWDVVSSPSVTGVNQDILQIAIPTAGVELDEFVLGSTFKSVTSEDDYISSGSFFPEVEKLVVVYGSGSIKIKIPEIGGKICIYDLQGRKLFSEIVYDNEYFICDKTLGNGSGVMLLKYILNYKCFVSKIII